MITQLNTYEGVPIGGNNFEDFLAYIRGFLGANFGFSTNLLQNQGGFFDDDNFAYLNRASPPNNVSFFVPDAAKPSGSLFGKYGTEFYRFEVLSVNGAGEEPQVYKWVLLATDSDSPTGMIFSNAEGDASLPYRPVRKRDSLAEYEYGYQEIRFNGIIQDADDYDFSYSPGPFSSDPTTYSAQTVTLNTIKFGAESPSPEVNGRYDGFMSDPADGISRDTFDNYDSTVNFEYTNFSIDFGAHIALRRRDGTSEKYVYIPQDLSSGEAVSPGTFKVLDFSRGTIKLNITNAQLQELVFTGENIVTTLADQIKFVVVSLEQLKEEFVGGIGNYSTRYGEVYNGSTTDAILLEYIFDGSQNLLRVIPESDYFSGLGSLLLQDSNGRYSDGVVLAAEYYGIPESSRIEEVQATRYMPDTLQLYYQAGIIKDLGSYPDSEIRCIVELNTSSWYNRDVLDSDYYPVSRADEAYYSLIHQSETTLFGDTVAFDPNSSFQIVDTVSLQSLSDVGPINNDEVLIYNGGTFSGIDYTLSALLDTTITSPQELQVLQRSGGSWINRNLNVVMSSVDLATEVRYTTGLSGGLGAGTDDNVLVTKGYVSSTVASDISTHANIGVTNDNAAHGASSFPVFNKIIKRDGIGVAQVATSTTSATGTSNDIMNINWLYLKSGSVPTANTFVRRDSSGRFRAASPSHGSDVVNKDYITNTLNNTVFNNWIDSGAFTIPSGVYSAGSITLFNTLDSIPSGSVLSIELPGGLGNNTVTAYRNTSTGTVYLALHITQASSANFAIGFLVRYRWVPG